jgi:hypothetical protein
MAALQLIYERSQVINRPDRITGDAAIMIVDKIITKVKRSHLNFQEAQEIIEIFIKDQLLIPEFYQDPALKSLRSSKKKALILHLKKIVNDYREGI